MDQSGARKPRAGNSGGKPNAAAPASGTNDFVWDNDNAPGVETGKLCKRIAETGKLYRVPGQGIFRLEIGKPVQQIATPEQLEGFIREHFKVSVVRDGNVVGRTIKSRDLKILLASDALQSELKTVDHITSVVTFNSSWEMTKPGYNAGSAGDSYFYTGDAVSPIRRPVLIGKFIGAMSFKDNADATNAVALGLTTLLRFNWLGGKPFGAVTANKSQAGKDTVLDFAAGRTRHTEISWHHRDWATQIEAVRVLKDREVGMLTLGNIRSSGAIASSFIERTVTAPDMLLQSSKSGNDCAKRGNDFLVAASANNGSFSPDLMNRAISIRLEMQGSAADRRSPIGNLREEFLPANQVKIEAEFCGMIENWKAKGCPLDTSAKHPMTGWAQTMGGILKVNGFKDFLGNLDETRSGQDAVLESLGTIAHSLAGKNWVRIGEVRKVAKKSGLIGRLVERIHRESQESVERQLGVICSAHLDEKLTHDADDGIVRQYVVSKSRNRQNGAIAIRYRFEEVKPSAKKAAFAPKAKAKKPAGRKALAGTGNKKAA